MKLITTFLLPCVLLVTGMVHAEWPMSNDPAFDPAVQNPAYPESTGPRILLDGAHHNFFAQWGFIKPFADLARADGSTLSAGMNTDHYDWKQLVLNVLHWLFSR